jgi:MHS family proline/betaine transporter-like MFS transporter
VGNAVEWYDFAVFGALASTMSHLFFPSAGRAALALTFAVLAVSVVVRPVGAIMVGRLADRSGRRGPLGATIVLMSGATAAIALLPTWSSVGVLAPVLLLLARLVQGFSVGGEVPSALAYIVESAPPGRRGWYGGWHLASIALGITSGYAVAAVLSATLSDAALNDWGWRVAFALAAPLGLIGYYIRRRLDETPGFASLRSPTAPPLGHLLRRRRTSVLRGFAVVAALSVAFNVWFIFLPTHLVTTNATELGPALGACVLGLLAMAAAAPAAGRLSDRLGRRPVLIAATVGLAVAVGPAFALAHGGSPLPLLLSNLLVGGLTGLLVVSAFVAELFPTEWRATGTAVTYGMSTSLLGGPAPLAATVLVALGLAWSVPVLIAVVAVLAALAAFRADETAFADLPRGASPAAGATGDGRSRAPVNRAG